MELKETISNLKKLENRSLKKKYIGDATEYSFRRHTLLLLSKISKKKSQRKPSKWQLFIGKYLRNGKTIQEASKDWKKKKR